MRVMNDSLVKKPARPFLKWIGGKSQLLSQLRSYYPQGLENGDVSTYVEPFIGGGAVFFDIMSQYGDKISNSVINDINPNVINAYRVIRDNTEELIGELESIQINYLGMSAEGRAEFYYQRRDEYNSSILSPVVNNDPRRAALLIYLNKTCFNGLYRINRSGIFNASHGRYPKPAILDADNLNAVSLTLQDTEILCGSYQETSHLAYTSDSFIYLDPPYRPITRTANFNSYDMSVFDDAAQYELGEFVANADVAGAKILLSNSDPKNSDPDDNFFDDLYSQHNVNRVSARRSVSTNGAGRGAVSEVLVSNYNDVIPEENKEDVHTLFSL